MLDSGDADIAINLAGGQTHARRNHASGFHYVNDVVLGTLELLRRHRRVLVVNLGHGHCDAVEDAFYATDRVCVLSFHAFGPEIFPGTGHTKDIGIGAGVGTSVNVPLRQGAGDATFGAAMDAVLGPVVDRFCPSAVVLVLGADALAGDRIGRQNLSLAGHTRAVRAVRALGLPMLVLGGEGTSLRNTALCWASSVAALLDSELPRACAPPRARPCPGCPAPGTLSGADTPFPRRRRTSTRVR